MKPESPKNPLPHPDKAREHYEKARSKKEQENTVRSEKTLPGDRGNYEQESQTQGSE